MKKLKSILALSLVGILFSSSLAFGAQIWDPKLYSKTITGSVVSPTNSFPTTKTLTVDDYTGDLVKKGASTPKLVSGSFTPADTKWVTNQPSADYNIDGYLGHLTAYEESSAYSKVETVNSEYIYWGGELQPEYSEFPYTLPYTHVTGETANLVKTGTPIATTWGNESGATLQCHVDICRSSSSAKSRGEKYAESRGYKVVDVNARVSGELWQINVTYMRMAWIQRYTGHVTISVPAVIKYQGNVTKPASDTRVYHWEQIYEGVGYKGGYYNSPELMLSTPSNNSYFRN